MSCTMFPHRGTLNLFPQLETGRRRGTVVRTTVNNQGIASYPALPSPGSSAPVSFSDPDAKPWFSYGRLTRPPVERGVGLAVLRSAHRGVLGTAKTPRAPSSPSLGADLLIHDEQPPRDQMDRSPWRPALLASSVKKKGCRAEAPR